MTHNLEQKLSNVISRHPNLNISSLMHNESLGFKPEDKKAIEEHEQAGGNKNQVSSSFMLHLCTSCDSFMMTMFQQFAKILITKGPHTIKELQSLANDHSAKGMKDFAIDMAKEFGL